MNTFWRAGSEDARTKKTDLGPHIYFRPLQNSNGLGRWFHADPPVSLKVHLFIISNDRRAIVFISLNENRLGIAQTATHERRHQEDICPRLLKKRHH
jgi:hypothetical protein